MINAEIRKPMHYVVDVQVVTSEAALGRRSGGW